MEEMRLREVCNYIGVSRRAVQGYEKAGLVRASGKTDRGYLIYDEPAQNRIARILLFQKMGFSIKEIKEIIDGPNPVLKAALESQKQKLMQGVDQTNAMIDVIQEMLRHL